MSPSRSISDAMGPLEEALLSPTTLDPNNKFGVLLNELLSSARGLRYTEAIISLTNRLNKDDFANLLKVLLDDPSTAEHFAASLGIEALKRADRGFARLGPLLYVVVGAGPPERAKRFLTDASACYLMAQDNACVAMCRGAIEVLTEERWDDVDDPGKMPSLGKAIGTLKEGNHLTPAQAEDMWYINRQAKEVLHDELGSEPINAFACLERLARLLRELHPHT